MIAKQPQPSLIEQLPSEIKWLHQASLKQSLKYYQELINSCKSERQSQFIVAELGKGDRFFLLTHLLNRIDAIHPWIYERCREVEASPDDHIDLWSRGHYKSTIITFAGSLQEIVKDPDVTIGIFSHTRPIAKAFLRQIKLEMETNKVLVDVYPDIFWKAPHKDALLWSEEAGITVKRKSNPKEATVESWGLVDGQPAALDCETPILTTEGWKRHGDLSFGDFVFDGDGEPVMVIHNTGPMMDKPCSEVVFSDTEIVAADDHLWPVHRVISRRNQQTGKQDGGWSEFETEIVRTTDLPLSVGEERDKRRRLPRTPVLKMPTRVDLPIPPYILGMWLGDGSSDCGIITTGDEEVMDFIEANGYGYSVAQDRGNYKMYRVAGLREKLKACSILWNKHIPHEYLFSSESDRRALFQGLMDSDGSCRSDGWGTCTFTNTNPDLIDGVHYLAASLGMKPWRISPPYHDGNPKHAPRFTVSFLGIKSERPFKLSRKIIRCKDFRRNDGRYVRGIKRVVSRAVNCIQVADESGIYLAGRALVPTHNSKHFKLRIYDDVVTRESVTTGDQIMKTTESWELSLNLSSRPPRQWIIGTRYHFADTYKTILDRMVTKSRIYPATDDGTPDGKPIFLSQAEWDKKKKESGPYIIACQMLLNPIAGSEQNFKPEWVRRWEVRPHTLNVFIMCDPADSKHKNSSNTAMAVIGLDTAHNKYLLDGACHKMNLTERWEMLKKLHERWTKEPGIQGVYVGYEKYGMQSDIQHFQQMMEIEGKFFPLEELSWTHDDTSAKDDRIKRLVPDMSSWRFFFPYDGEETKRQREARERGQEYLCSKPIKRINHDQKVYNLVEWFMNNEYLLFPATQSKDFFDVMSRIYDMPCYIIPGVHNEADTLPQLTED